LSSEKWHGKSMAKEECWWCGKEATVWIMIPEAPISDDTKLHFRADHKVDLCLNHASEVAKALMDDIVVASQAVH
jgi:hypothetical protein